jgi:uncharacterized protein
MGQYLLLFGAGFAGSFHCVGMCGGFACAVGRDPRGNGATIMRHLLYNTGRLTTYCFMGVLAGMLGQIICTPQGLGLSGNPLDLAQRVLAILAGLLMIAMALEFFGLVPNSSRGALGFGGSIFSAALRRLLGQPGPTTPIAIGVFNGFLPCPLVYAFLAQAASTTTAPSGFLVMLAFGLGTFPAMLVMGGVGRLLAPVWRQRGVWLAGSCILLLGLVTLSRGILPLGAHLAHGWLPVPA